MVKIDKFPMKSYYSSLGWLSDANNYGEYARNCSIFIVPANDQGVVQYSNAGCTSAGWQWSNWFV